MTKPTNTGFSIAPKTKFAEVLNEHNILISLLPRFHIPLGFGDKTLEEVCADNEVSLPLFLLICNVYICDDFVPEISDIRQIPIEELLQYLQTSHEDYRQYKTVHIEHHLKEISRDWNVKYRSLITNFFFDYKTELIAHFQYEEKVVFPYIHHLIHHQPFGKHYTINMFKKHHSNIEDKLHDFTNLLMKYIPEDVDRRECIDMLLDIFAFAEDVGKHTLIENKILIPYIQALENEEK